jgi:hypothetical protein
MTVRLRLAECALALSVTLGCQPREPNSDLRNFLEPSPTPTVVVPESPYTLSGTIIEAGTGASLANVLVETVGRTTLTNESGFYEFTRLGRTDVSFSKDGFEAPGPFHVPMNRPTAIDASLQRVIRATADQALTATLFPNDPSFNVSGDPWADLDGWVCGPPCKVVRVAVPLSGRIRARVTWQPSGSDFGLFLAQRMGSAAPRLSGSHGASGDLIAEMSATGGTDARVYFGRVDYSNPPSGTKLTTDLQFSVTTSISP